MIILNENYAIDVTATSYNLVKTRISQGEKSKGEIATDIVGYYTGISGALKAFGKEMVRDTLKSQNMTLSDALKLISETNAKVEQCIEDATGGRYED